MLTSADTNLSMLTDFYELSMSQTFFNQGIHEKIACFDLFFRKVPEQGGFALMAGTEQLVEYIRGLRFSDENLEYLRSFSCFSEAFLNYLKNMRFSCDIYAVREGTPLFPHEPIVKVKGPLIQAQLIETMLLLTVNHQSLIATKATRIARAVEGRKLMEFGARRAQGADASVYGARAAYIGGVDSTSCTLAGELFGIPLSGTMAHSFIQSFPTEYEAFKSYAESFPDSCVLLVDTYNTLAQGIPNAIRVHEEVLAPAGKALQGIRIDSGDLAYLSIQARKMLDEAGLKDCKIIASNSLDEMIIRDLMRQGARIDAFGVGERLITSRAEPVFGGVYKLCAIEREPGILEPRMKISENVEKVTNPGDKKLIRFYDRATDMALADLICLADEEIPEDGEYEIFHPVETWKRKTLTNYYTRELLEPVFLGGNCVYEKQDIHSIRSFAKREQAHLWDSVKRFEYPHIFYVDLSEKLWQMKQDFLKEHGSRLGK